MRIRSSESALRVVLVAALVACITAPVASVAQDDMAPVASVANDDTGAPPESAARDWYGWQIMLADVASSLAIVAGLSTDRGEVAVIGGVGCLVGGPLVHLGHDEGGGAARSILLRLLVPLAAGALGVGLAGGGGGGCSGCGAAAGGIIGASAGMLTAMVIDWATASSSQPPSSPSASTGSLAPHEGSLTPLVVVAPNAMTMMLVVRF